MTTKRFFVVIDVDDFAGDQGDMAIWLDTKIGGAFGCDVTVYENLIDLEADLAEEPEGLNQP